MFYLVIVLLFIGKQISNDIPIVSSNLIVID